MLKKVIISIALIILLAGASGVFAEGKKYDAKGKSKAAKKQGFKQHQESAAWFKSLKKAHRAGDMEKIGHLIKKMEQRKKWMHHKKGWSGKKGEKQHKQKGPGAFKKKFGKGKSYCCKNKGGDWRGMGGYGRGFGRRGGRGFGQCGMGRQGRGFGRRGGRGFGQCGMGRQGRGFGRRGGMSGHGRGSRRQWQDEKEFDWDW